MTAEEFKQKYKVGDKVRLDAWDATEFIEILFLGEKSFLAKDQDLYEDAWLFVYGSWLPYTEPKKKKKVKMSQAVFNRIESNGCFLPDGLYSSKEDAIIDWLPYKLIQWPLVVNGEEQWIEIEVEE